MDHTTSARMRALHRSRQEGSILLLLLLCILLGLIVLIVIPNFVGSHTSPMNSCINNLRQLDGAVHTWALEKKITDTNAIPSSTAIKPYLRHALKCPAGGKYTLGSLSQKPRCSVLNHRLPPNLPE